jgi:cell division protein FtsL
MSGICFIICLFSGLFYCTTKIGLHSYNITLQQEEQRLASQIVEQKSAVEDLQAEVHSMQDKGRVLSLLGDEVQDNSSNIYVIGNSD